MITQYRVTVSALDDDHNAVLWHDRYLSALELEQSNVKAATMIGFSAEKSFEMIQSKAAERAAV